MIDRSMDMAFIVMLPKCPQAIRPYIVKLIGENSMDTSLIGGD
jgi:hypothetical protein